MALKKARLNNMKLSYARQTEVYEAVMVDLYLIGALPKEVVEKLTGREILDTLTAPAKVNNA